MRVRAAGEELFNLKGGLLIYWSLKTVLLFQSITSSIILGKSFLLMLISFSWKCGNTTIYWCAMCLAVPRHHAPHHIKNKYKSISSRLFGEICLLLWKELILYCHR